MRHLKYCGDTEEGNASVMGMHISFSMAVDSLFLSFLRSGAFSLENVSLMYLVPVINRLSI